jgi:tetratricopeptide (TPR) repeat protein
VLSHRIVAGAALAAMLGLVPGAVPDALAQRAGSSTDRPAFQPPQPGEDEHAFWRRVYAADTREAYEGYLRAFPRGQYADIARLALNTSGAAAGTPAPAGPAPGPVRPPLTPPGGGPPPATRPGPPAPAVSPAAPSVTVAQVPADRQAKLDALRQQMATALLRVRAYLAYYDQINRLAVAQGRMTSAEADGRLRQKAAELSRQSYSDAELRRLVDEHRDAVRAYLQGIEQRIAGGGRLPGGGASDLDRSHARSELARLRREYDGWLARGLDPLPVLEDTARVLGWMMGSTRSPAELDPFAGQSSRLAGAFTDPRFQAMLRAAEAPTPSSRSATPPVGPVTPPSVSPAAPPVSPSPTPRVGPMPPTVGPSGPVPVPPTVVLRPDGTIVLPPPGGEMRPPVSPGSTTPLPGPAPTTLAHAYALLSAGQYREALAAFDDILRGSPGSPDAHIGRGVSLNWLGDVQEARREYEGVVKAEPGRPQLRIWIAELSLALRDYGRAESALQEELRLFPPSAAAYSYLGTLRMMEGRQAEAAQTIAAALSLDPGIASARYGIGTALGSLGQDRRALIEFASVLALDPTFTAAYYAVGVYSARVGAAAQAIQAFEAYLQRDPSSEWAQQARQELSRLRAAAPLPNPAGHPLGLDQPCPPGTTFVLGGCLPTR